MGGGWPFAIGSSLMKPHNISGQRSWSERAGVLELIITHNFGLNKSGAFSWPMNKFSKARGAGHTVLLILFRTLAHRSKAAQQRTHSKTWRTFVAA